jgi:Type II secretion system (T2SS), protein M
MTGRDRMVLIVISVVVVLGAAWMLVVSPERQQANKLAGQVAAAQAQVTAAESTVSSARAAQSQYAAAYASLVNIGKAVPPSDEVPALIDQLTQASNEKSVQFSAISPGASTGASASASTTTTTGASTGSSAQGAAASGTQAAAFTQLPFSFTFEGSYFDLEHLFRKLTEFATLNAAGKLEVNGRLLTINSLSLSTAGGSEGAKSGGQLTGSISATAYVMPASAGLTATPSPGSSTSAGASPASSTTGSSSTPAPAIVKVNP